MGYDPDRIVLVLNRADSRVGIDDDDVLAVVVSSPNVRIPSRRRGPALRQRGSTDRPGQARFAAAKAFRSLADEFLRREGQARLAARARTAYRPGKKKDEG
jgi:hypothetical protein